MLRETEAEPGREDRRGAPRRDTRQALIASATRLFSQRGYDGTSVREIAEKAGVNLALVSYHFSGKEGLYSACIEPYGRGELELARELLGRSPPASARAFRSRLLQFFSRQAELRLRDPDVSIIVSRECDGGMPVAETLFRETFLQTVQLLRDYFVLGQRKGFIRRRVDPLHAAGLIYSAISQILRARQIAAKFHQRDLADSRFREALFTEWIDLLWEGMETRARHPASTRNSSSSRSAARPSTRSSQRKHRQP